MSDDDPDRDAILARRKKLIAVALAGLTSAAGCGDDAGAGPQPCLDMAPVPEETTLTPIDPPEDESEEVAEEQQGEDVDEGERPVPHPPPQVCLVPPVAEDEAQEPRPQPCLRVARPRNRPAPRPQACLDVDVPPEEIEEVAPPPDVSPQPCLSVGAPEKPGDDRA